MRIAYVNGSYVPIETPAIQIEDRGYQFADGVYEVCALQNNYLLDEEEHLNRLEKSLHALNIPVPVSRSSLQHIMRETIRRNRVKNGIVYIQITRGAGARNHQITEGLRPNLVVTVRPLSPEKRDQNMRSGISVIVLEDIRWGRCDVKSISLLPNVLAREEARCAGADDAVLIDAKGFVTEATAANIWIVDAQGQLRTRPVGDNILAGITRKEIARIAEDLQISVKEQAFTIGEIETARECFLSAASKIITPVVKINGTKIADGDVGHFTQKLSMAYDQSVRLTNINM